MIIIFLVLDQLSKTRLTVILLLSSYNTENKQYEKSYLELKKTLPHLQRAGVFDHFTLHLLYRDEPFGPKVIVKCQMS